MQFTKLFNSILDSTIWQESAETKIVWISMLAMCDRYGDVFASVPGLASRAGVTVSQCETALSCFLSPDKYSRTRDHEGRRIREIDGGWSLLNHGKYRELLSAEERREYNRRKQAEYRASKRGAVNDMSNNVKNVNDMSAMSTHTEADTEAEEEKEPPNPLKGERGGANPRKRPTLEQAISAGKDIGITSEVVSVWWHAREASDWMKGTGGGGTTPVGSNWRADLTASKGWAGEQAAKNPAPKKREFID